MAAESGLLTRISHATRIIRSPRAKSGAADPPTLEPIVAAEAAHLHYVNDRLPGITRVRAGRGFVYRDPNGRTIRDPEELRRIESIGIPPAGTDVWRHPQDKQIPTWTCLLRWHTKTHARMPGQNNRR